MDNNIIKLTKSIIREVFELKEAIGSLEDLHPNLNSKKNEIPPVLLTWDEYFNKINQNSKSHDSSAYQYNYDNKNKFVCGKDSVCKMIRHSRVGNIELRYILEKRPVQYAKFVDDKYVGVYDDNELKEMGKESFEYSIIVINDRDIVVGAAQDEWGCVLIYVVKEFKELGIGEELVKLYREIYPYKPSGGFTSAGYAQFKKYYNWMVGRALRNGLYSDLVKRGEISIERVKEILGSRDKNVQFSDVEDKKKR